jgi:hypothetical protein
MATRVKIIALLLLLLGVRGYCADYEINSVAALRKYLRLENIAERHLQTSEADTIAIIGGQGFIAGYVDACLLSQIQGAKSDILLPENIELSELRRKIEKYLEIYLERHPDTGNQDPLDLLGDALAEMFPNPAFKRTNR